MSDEYRIVRYRPALRDDVLALQMAGQGSDDWRSVEARWRWKYEENPYLPEPLAVLAADASGRLVGMLALYGSMWEFGDPAGRVAIPCPADAYVAPPHRRRGFYRRLFTAC